MSEKVEKEDTLPEKNSYPNLIMLEAAGKYFFFV